MAQRFKADELAIVRDFMRQAKEVFQRQVHDGRWGDAGVVRRRLERRRSGTERAPHAAGGAPEGKVG